MELPSIECFKLGNILKSIQDDSVEQLVESIQMVNNNYNNDLNQELLELVQFQSQRINSVIVKNTKLAKNMKIVKHTDSSVNIDDELLELISKQSSRTKELIAKLYKFEKLLPLKERLFNESNSHRLHYPLLYELGSKILDLNDDVVSLDEDEDIVIPTVEEEPTVDIEDSEEVPKDDPIQESLQDSYPNVPNSTTTRKDSLKDRRISMLSKNIDDIISERAQQQQLQSITNPASFIFPTKLTKKTSSQFNEDVRLILIKDPTKNEKLVIFGLKKFL